MTDEQAFRRFYDREHAAQVRRSYLMIGSNEAANDIVHEAMLQVYRRWGELKSPGAYLNRAVLNGCREHGRFHSAQNRLHVRLVNESLVATPRPVDDALDDVLARLPFNQRAAVMLRFYAGFTTEQIADTLGCPPGSVGPWIDRALKKMRKELS